MSIGAINPLPRICWGAVVVAAIFFLLIGAAGERKPDPMDLIEVLDALHNSASKADAAKYFALFAPDAVFLGTDATERWTVDEFKAFAKPYFDQGKGWTYTPRK